MSEDSRVPEEQPTPEPGESRVPTDPTLVRNQPAIRVARRRWWLVPGGIVAGLAIVLLVAALSLQLVIPLTGIVFVAVIYTAMLISAVAVRSIGKRNTTLASLFITMAVVAALIFVVLLNVEAQGG